MRLTQIFAAAAIALVSTFAVADDAADKAIRKSLENLQLEVPVESISASPLSGLYEVRLKGSRVLYASADGQYIVQGNMFQLKDGKPVNLTERTERLGVSKLVNAIPVILILKKSARKGWLNFGKSGKTQREKPSVSIAGLETDCRPARSSSACKKRRSK